MKILVTFGLLATVGAFPQTYYPRSNEGPHIEPRAVKCAKVPSWMKSSLTDRIVGGKAANGPIPWQVSVQARKEGFVSQHFCGGTILDANTVLSAAHCFANQNTGEPEPVTNLFIVAGAHDLTKNSAEQAVAIASLVWTTGDDKYDSQRTMNDIVIVKLAKALTFNANVAPACLPAANFFPDKKKAVVSGWGMLKWDGSKAQEQDSSLFPKILQYVDAPLINDADCINNSKWPSGENNQPQLTQIHKSMLCAGYSDGTNKDSCRGDSGGPLVIPASASDDTAVIVGVVSFGPRGCAVNGYPGIYARVTNFLPWIKKNSGGSSGGSSGPPAPSPSTTKAPVTTTADTGFPASWFGDFEADLMRGSFDY